MDADRLHHREVTIRDRTVDYFEPEGPLVGDLLDLFDQRTQELLSRGRRDIRVGCRALTLMESTAVGVLLSIRARLSRNHGRLVIDYQGNQRIRDLFAITKLDGFFKDPDDDPDAGTAGRSAPLLPPPQRGTAGNEKQADPRAENPEE